ncbi:MAG: DUF3102 domain-containing protein [Verrucomicrobiales bacterium]
MNEIQTYVTQAEQLRQLQNQITAAVRVTLTHAMEAGSILASVKRQLPHGEFTPWLQANVPTISDRTARRYMAVHRNRDMLKTDTVSDLTEAYEMLKAPKTAGANRINNLHDDLQRDLQMGLQQARELRGLLKSGQWDSSAVNVNAEDVEAILSGRLEQVIESQIMEVTSPLERTPLERASDAVAKLSAAEREMFISKLTQNSHLPPK